ncbi:MAG TPA: hypothetical protein VFZ46_03505 [Nitrososphaeraceae archaeon]
MSTLFLLNKELGEEGTNSVESLAAAIVFLVRVELLLTSSVKDPLTTNAVNSQQHPDGEIRGQIYLKFLINKYIKGRNINNTIKSI